MKSRSQWHVARGLLTVNLANIDIAGPTGTAHPQDNSPGQPILTTNLIPGSQAPPGGPQPNSAAPAAIGATSGSGGCLTVLHP